MSYLHAFISLGLCLGIVVCLTACAGGQPRPGDWERVVSISWALTKIEGRAPIQSAKKITAPLSLELSDDGRAVGFAGVNRFFGSYESTPEGGLRFAAIGSTRMYHDDPPGLMKQEELYLNAIGQIDRFRIQSGKLILLSDNHKRLVFTPDISAENHPTATPE